MCSWSFWDVPKQFCESFYGPLVTLWLLNVLGEYLQFGWIAEGAPNGSIQRYLTKNDWQCL